VSLRMVTNLRLADLRLTTAQQRTTGQNLPSDLYYRGICLDRIAVASLGVGTACFRITAQLISESHVVVNVWTKQEWESPLYEAQFQSLIL
jgi:hypothetical protein